MYWIALQPSNEQDRQAWIWRCLQLSPRVAGADEALVLEASTSLRLWGGRQRLLAKLLAPTEGLSSARWADANTALKAIGLLRLARGDETARRRRTDDMPLDVLTAAREHLAALERIGCRSWGDARRLPRAGLTRRFGAALVQALDCAYGERAESFRWEELPEQFDVNLELASLATSAPELLWTAQRLLGQLQLWLQARNRGILALELEWTLDLRRLDGADLPPHERMEIRTAQPTQDVTHLRRLIGEHLSRTRLAAPANHLRMRSVDSVPWGGASRSLLPDDKAEGESLEQFIERLSVRLGAGNVVQPALHADHRPERMQSWQPAQAPEAVAAKQATPSNAIYPSWLLAQPQRLRTRGEKPLYEGPLRLLVGPQRLETGWWDGTPGPAVRDYFIARSDHAGLLWVFRERASFGDEAGRADAVRWYLHGVYA